MGARRTRAETIRKLWNVDTRYCAQCWQPVHIVEAGDQAYLQCPNGCEPGGHVSEFFVTEQRRKDMRLAWEAAKNYPDLVEADGIMVRVAGGWRSLAELAREKDDAEMHLRFRLYDDGYDIDSDGAWGFHDRIHGDPRPLWEILKEWNNDQTREEEECQLED